MKLTKGKVISALLILLLALLALFPIPATSESGAEEQAAIEITIPDEEPPEEPEAIQIELDADDDEPAQEDVPEIEVSLEETEDDLPDEEPADELVIEDIQITEEAPEEPAQPEEEPADLAGVIAAHGYAYAVTAGETKVYGSSDLAEDQHVFTIAGGQLLLATACIDSETHSSVKVWFITGTGEAMTGYVPAQSLEEAPHDVDEANAMAAYGSGYVDSEAGILLAFVVQGDFPQTMEEAAPDDMVVEDIQIPDEEKEAAIEVVLPDEQEDEPIPAEPKTTEEHEEIPDSKQMLAEIGDFAFVTTNTRAFMEVDESAADDYYGDYFLGYFLKDAAVQVEDVMTDFLDRTWYSVSYIYGLDEGAGLTCEIVGTVYVLAEETAQTDLVERTATDYGYPPDYFRPMLLSSFYVDLEDHYGGVASFYVGESGLHATTGHDNEYKQIARHDEYGTIFATPHYLKGETAYCLEHTQPSPVVRDHASGPYQIVDLDGYKVMPGHSGYIFSDKTMHALAWVLRHTYPFMVLDRSDSDNEVWCRVAGQFAMREVIKQLEGDFYVMDYWEMDEFYRAYDQAPGVYLDYARWLAEEALAYVEDYGSVTVSNKSVSASGGKYIGTATLYTSADRLRISTSVGSVSGHSGGSDGEYEGTKTNEIMTGAQAIVKILGSGDHNPDPDRVEIPEPGAEFEVYLKRAGSYENARDIERDYLVTDENGYARTKELPYGVYVLRQTVGKDGYELKSAIEFKIDGTEDLVHPPIMTLSDRPILYRLRLIKTDAKTGKVITLPGASFKLKDAEGNYVTQTVYYPTEREIDTFTTDNSGAVTLPETVGWGLYFIEEVKAPEGYLIRDQELAVFVGRDGDTPDGVYELDIEIPNDPVSGRIVLHKKGLQMTGVHEEQDEYGNTVYTPVFEERYLAGAVFEVRAAEDIVGGDGTIWYQKDELVDTITTTEEGGDTSKELPLGRYVLIETQMPDGYIGFAEHYEVDLAYADEHTAVVEISTEIHNAYLSAQVSLTKVKEITQTVKQDDLVKQEIAVVPGEGFVFGLYVRSDIPYSGGTLMADTLVATGATDADGKLILSGMFPHGDYYLKELSAPDGWKMSAEQYSIRISSENRAEEQAIIRVSMEEPILNRLVYTPVTLTKTDITGENTVPGALIVVRNSKGEIVYQAYTDESGEIPDMPLTPGDYTFREILAPEGYELNEAEMTFTVHEDGTVTGDTTIRDDFTRVQLIKHDENGRPLADTQFILSDENGRILKIEVSDENGLVTFERIPYGTFVIEESRPVNGYLLSDKKVTITVTGAFINPIKPLDTFVNYPNEAVIRKVDQKGKALPGAVFGLFDENGKRKMTAVSDEKGIVRFTKIPHGDFTIREIEPPNGYLLCKEVVNLTIDDSYVSSDTPIATLTNHLKRVRYQKVDTFGKYLPGVEFSLINAATGEVVETVVSDDHGEFVFTKFDYGDWIICETKAPEGFNRMDDLMLHVDENWKEPEPFTCVNIPDYYEFIKTDNRRNPIPGVKFALEDEDGNFLRELVSGDDGIVRAENLTPGKYVIRETEAAEGYTKTDEVIEITIDENYVPPKRLKRLKNYSTIQTGVEIEMTPVMWVGAGLMAVTAVVMVVYAVRSRKRRK